MTLNTLNVNIILSKLRQICFPYSCIIKDYHLKSFKCHLKILHQAKWHVVSNVLVFFILKRGERGDCWREWWLTLICTDVNKFHPQPPLVFLPSKIMDPRLGMAIISLSGTDMKTHKRVSKWGQKNAFTVGCSCVMVLCSLTTHLIIPE